MGRGIGTNKKQKGNNTSPRSNFHAGTTVKLKKESEVTEVSTEEAPTQVPLQKCTNCKGNKQVWTTKTNHWSGMVAINCPHCGGTGNEPDPNKKLCLNCGGDGIRPADGVDSMGLPRWGPEGMDNRVDRTCVPCNGTGTQPE